MKHHHDKTDAQTKTAASHDDLRNDRHHHGHHHEGGHDHHIKHTPEEWAQRLDDPSRNEWQKPTELIAVLDIEKGETVAELGAGTGFFLKYLSEAVGDQGTVLAHDVEDDLVAYMKDRAEKEGLKNIVARKCPFDDPALPKGGVHRVLIVNTWHHLSNRVEYAETLKNALSDHGALYVVDFTKASTVGPPPEAKLHSDQIVSELEQAGFNAVLVPVNLPQQYVIRGTRP